MSFLKEKIEGAKKYFAEQGREARKAYYLRFESPEAIQNFLYHRPNCGKTGPLERVVDPSISLIASGWGGGIPDVYTRCIECRGSERDLIK